ncbi:MAG: MFS transporter [Rhizobiales bacterium]|nr:MFS transporter [Hyphomicrobiales bacterium]
MPALLALFIAAFAFGTTEFVIAGVLPEVAEGLGVTVVNAGYLISAYAMGIAVGGPLLTVLTARVPRRTLLVWLALAFTAGQVACALAPDFATMLALRVAVAFAHGVYFGVAMVVATGIVPEAQRGRAVAIVLAGLTVSNVVGVPLGTAIGNLWDWRATFWCMAGIGVVALVAILALIPAHTGRDRPHAGLAAEIRVLGRHQVWTSLIVMLMLMIGQFGLLTYIAPYLTEVTGLDPSWVPWVLLLHGLGATAGVFLGGRLADWKLMPWLVATLALQAVMLVLLYLASPYALPMASGIFVWGALNFTIGTLVQTRILGATADAANLASALIPSGFNVGIALASSLAAALLNAGYAYATLPLVGAAAMVVAIAAAAASWAVERGPTKARPAASRI